jgi:hypothetical protein
MILLPLLLLCRMFQSCFLTQEKGFGRGVLSGVVEHQVIHPVVVFDPLFQFAADANETHTLAEPVAAESGGDVRRERVEAVELG